MASENQAQTLSAYHTILQRTLLELREITATKLASIDLDLARKASWLQQLHGEARSLAAKIETSINRRFFLDTGDLVRQEVEGQSSYHHVHKLIRPTPNFVFNLRTRYPIRKYVDSLGDSSRWKTLLCQEGGTTFNGEVKTKVLQDGRAEVSLYGWRREMFASEISYLNDLVANLIDSQTIADTAIYQAKSEITTLQSERELIQRELDDREQDMKTLGQRIFEEANATERVPYLEAESISGLARCYGLVSEVMKGEDNMPVIGEALAWLIRSTQNELISALEHLKDGESRYSSCLSNNRLIILDYLRTLKYNCPTEHHDRDFDKVVVEIAMTEDDGYEIVRKAQNTALDDLSQLDKSFIEEKEAIRVDCEEKTDASTAARETTQIIMTELVRAIDLTKRDQRAHTASRHALESDKRHVGVVAALNSRTSGSDAWMSVYRGMRVADKVY